MSSPPKKLEQAFSAGNVAEVKRLLEGWDIPAADIITCTRSAVKKNQRGMARLLLPHISQYPKTISMLMYHATTASNERMLQLIIQINSPDSKIKSKAVQLAAKSGNTNCLNILLANGEREIIVQAFENGAGANQIAVVKQQMARLKLSESELEGGLKHACLEQAMDVVELLWGNTIRVERVQEILVVESQRNKHKSEQGIVLLQAIALAGALQKQTANTQSSVHKRRL